MIWHNQQLPDISDHPASAIPTLSTHLGMEFVEIGSDFLRMRMPVDDRTRQPYGMLHGGASVALAETVGGVASALVIDHSKLMCVGLEINANHIRSVRKGFVTATCKPVHLGSKTHVWDIRLHDDEHHLICISRLTMAIMSRR